MIAALSHNNKPKLPLWAHALPLVMYSTLCHQVTPLFTAHFLLYSHNLRHTVVAIIFRPLIPLRGCGPLLSPSFFFSCRLTARQKNSFPSACPSFSILVLKLD